MQRNGSSVVLAARFVLAGAAAAFPAYVVGGASKIDTIRLEPTSFNAGNTGRAMLMPQDRHTHLVLQFTGVPPNTGLPVRLLTSIHEGSCREPSPQAAYELNDNVHVTTASGRWARTMRGAFGLSHTVPLPPDELLGGRYVLLLRSMPADGGRTIFCGELRRPSAPR
jgi:hypothetical protein